MTEERGKRGSFRRRLNIEDENKLKRNGRIQGF